MKRRIRKKKLTLEIYNINQAFIYIAYLKDKYKDDNGINGFVARLGLPVVDMALRYKRRLLTGKLKRGDY